MTDAVDIYCKKPHDKIVLVGSGSSNNIANSAKYAIEKYLNVKCEVVTPISFVEYDYKFNENSFVFCLSQSGRSTNTIAALEKCKDMNFDFAGISLNLDSPLKNYSDHVLEYGSFNGENDVFVCRYFASSVLFFILFALQAGLKIGTCNKDEYKIKIKELENVVNYMPKVIEKTNNFYEQNKHEIHSMKRCMAMGIGYTLGLTNEACLKMSETTGISTNGYEFEEFMHGPAYEVKKDHGLFFLDGDENVHDRLISVYEASYELTDRVYLITYTKNNNKNVISIPVHCDPAFRPLLYVIPFQIIPGRICEDLNIRAITIYNYRASQKVITKTDK